MARKFILLLPMMTDHNDNKIGLDDCEEATPGNITRSLPPRWKKALLPGVRFHLRIPPGLTGL